MNEISSSRASQAGLAPICADSNFRVVVAHLGANSVFRAEVLLPQLLHRRAARWPKADSLARAVTTESTNVSRTAHASARVERPPIPPYVRPALLRRRSNLTSSLLGSQILDSFASDLADWRAEAFPRYYLRHVIILQPACKCDSCTMVARCLHAGC